MSIGRINCATNAGYPKLTTAPSYKLTVATLRLNNPLQPPFEEEIVARKVVAAPQDPNREQSTALRESVVDVAPNVNGGLLQDIAELHHQGIEVDGNNEPAPENTQLTAPATHTIGQWVTPTICPRRADMNCRNTKGVWRLHSWPKISEMTELSISMM